MGYTGLSQREFFAPFLSRDGASAGMAGLAFGVRKGSLLMGMELTHVSGFLQANRDAYSDTCWFVYPRSVPGVMAALDAAIHENTVASI